jgi:hypothetical protein
MAFSSAVRAAAEAASGMGPAAARDTPRMAAHTDSFAAAGEKTFVYSHDEFRNYSPPCAV